MVSTEHWYVWDGREDRFVPAKRPPQDSKIVEALQHLKIRLATVNDRQKTF